MNSTQNREPPENSHYHGQILHDHEHGNVEHDHGERESHYRNQGFLRELRILFVILDVVGILAFVRTEQAASECADPLVSDFAQTACTEYTAIHELGLTELLIFSLLAILGFISGREK